jgi:hypothetical protein
MWLVGGLVRRGRLRGGKARTPHGPGNPRSHGVLLVFVSCLTFLSFPRSPCNTSEPFLKPHTLAFDHIYPIPGQALSSPPRTAILYASFQSTNFLQLHSHLLRLSSGPTPRVQYIFRPIPQDGVVKEKAYLSGYGVTLDLKKMDYLALDDRRSHNRSTFQSRSPLRLSSHARLH